SKVPSSDVTPRATLQPSGLSLSRHKYETDKQYDPETRVPISKTPHREGLAASGDLRVTMPIDPSSHSHPMTESTPLIRRGPIPICPPHLDETSRPAAVSNTTVTITSFEKVPGLMTNVLKTLPQTLDVALKSIPAVLLGSLLNILDGVSYGMIMFPGTPTFENFGPMGVSMFFLSTAVSQAVYNFGGSAFAGANGSMLIEVMIKT
ncbi:hypothetical protein H0H93_013482, partial [Arthromyces matolae]